MEKNMSSIVDTFQTLVQIDSPTGHEEKMAEFLMAFLSKRNIPAERDAIGNIFARVPGVGEPVFLSAHMDTVEPGRGVVPIVKNGIVISKGDTILGADNKATIAVILDFLGRLENKKHRPLEILFTVWIIASTSFAFAFPLLMIKSACFSEIWALPI